MRSWLDPWVRELSLGQKPLFLLAFTYAIF